MHPDTSLVKPVLAALTLATQIIGIVSFAFMMFDFYFSVEVLIQQAAGDNEVLQRLISETVLSYGPYLGCGVIGAIVAWLLILKGRYLAPWYLGASRILAWIWIPLFPVGTVLGVLVLGARSAALKSSVME